MEKGGLIGGWPTCKSRVKGVLCFIVKLTDGN
jgi:hypothetical protein